MSLPPLPTTGVGSYAAPGWFLAMRRNFPDNTLGEIDIEELFDDPQVVANGLVTEVEHIQEGKVKMVGPMAHYLGTPPAPPRSSPALGQHAAEILEGLGFTKQEIEAWREAGVIG